MPPEYFGTGLAIFGNRALKSMGRLCFEENFLVNCYLSIALQSVRSVGWRFHLNSYHKISHIAKKRPPVGTVSLEVHWRD